jgi:hypothetical protein
MMDTSIPPHIEQAVERRVSSSAQRWSQGTRSVSSECKS